MIFELNLDAIEVEERPMGPLPAGSYECVVEGCTVTDTKAGDKMLSVTYRVVTGDHNHMLTHSNPDVVKIGMEGIKKLANAVGITGKMTDPSVLADSQTLVAVSVSVRKSEEYGDSNSVKRVAALQHRPTAREPRTVLDNLPNGNPFKF